MNDRKRDRRRFLKQGAALAGFALGTTRSASSQTGGSEIPEARPKDSRAYGERSRFVTSVRTLDTSGSLNPLQDSLGIITPSALHNVQSRGYDPPDIDPRQYRLLIHGLVDRPLIFTMDELKRLPSVSRIHFIECSGNTGRTALEMKAGTVQQTHGKVSCSEWTGILLSLLLREVGVQKGASWLVAEGAEKGNRMESIPLEKAMDDVLVAYGQNGEALRPEQGYPLRLVVTGWNGGINVKWLRRMTLVDQPAMSKQEVGTFLPDGKGGWRFDSAMAQKVHYSEMPPKSVITFPSLGQKLPSRGFYEITGLAWSGWGAIRSVEVSTDGGRTWKDAQLQEPVYRKAFTRFRFAWNWDGGEAVLQSRCRDDQGNVQPTLAELSRAMGVNPDYWISEYWTSPETSERYGLNAVQPWKVTRDGSVHNAMFS